MSTLAHRFLDNACPDHHVRGRQDHRRAEATAMRLLAQRPELARYNLATAIVCGDIDAVRAAIARDRAAASTPIGTAGPARSGAGRANDLHHELGEKGWTPLLYLAFTRLPLQASRDQAVPMARLLLEAGADPNAFFMAGSSRYTPLTGVAGEGEEDRPPHVHREALTELLLAYGANPYDTQVVYNLGFHARYDWWLSRIHAHTVATGRADDWADPAWRMLDMGGYGCGARWFIERAIQRGAPDLVRWCLEHGASANAEPAPSGRVAPGSLLDTARAAGELAIAALLQQHGARGAASLSGDPVVAFTAAAFAGDRATAAALWAQHENVRQAPQPLFRAAERNRVDVLAWLLDLGVSPNAADATNTRALNHAAWSGALDAVQLLVERGAEIDAVEQNYGGTAFGNAAHFLHREVMDYLAPRTRDVWNLVYNGYLDRLREVLAEDPTRAQVDWDSWSPLLWLPPHDEALALETAQLLVQHGADPHRRDSTGTGPSDRAEALAMPTLAAWLRSATPTPTPAS